MIHKDISYFWWQDLTGPTSLITSIVETIQQGKAPLLVLPQTLPWRGHFSYLVQKELSNCYNTDFQMIKSQEKGLSLPEKKEDMVPYFMALFPDCGFRTRHKSLPEYFIQKKILENKILWFSPLSEEQFKLFRDFIKEFSSSDQGIFILEMDESHTRETVINGSNALTYRTHVTPYDLQLLCQMYLANKRTYPPSWKGYITSLLGNICDLDVEMMMNALESVNLSTVDPIHLFREEEGEIVFLPPDEMEALPNETLSPLVESRIWKAQIQVLFPLLEMLRYQLITIGGQDLEDLVFDYLQDLKQSTTIENAYDLEIGTLHYLLSQKSYYFQNTGFNYREIVGFIRTCRNLLAHRQCMSQEQISTLFQYMEQF